METKDFSQDNYFLLFVYIFVVNRYYIDLHTELTSHCLKPKFTETKVYYLSTGWGKEKYCPGFTPMALVRPKLEILAAQF